MKPKQRRYMPKQRAPILPQTHTMVFTVDTLTVVEASFTAMDAVFERQKHTRHPHLPFALETFSGVKQKVRGMLAQPGTTVPFDDNEITLLRACIQIYSIDLLCEPETPQRARLLSLCDQAAQLLPHPRPLLRVHD